MPAETEMRLTRKEWEELDRLRDKIRELEYYKNSPTAINEILIYSSRSDPAGATEKFYVSLPLNSFERQTLIRSCIDKLYSKLKEDFGL